MDHAIIGQEFELMIGFRFVARNNPSLLLPVVEMLNELSVNVNQNTSPPSKPASRLSKKEKSSVTSLSSPPLEL
jgi:hypothetical protein